MLNLSQRGQSEIRAGRNSLIRNLTQDDLVGALRDINGKPVRQIGSGKTWDHLQEVRQGTASLKNAKNGLIMEMKNYQIGSNEFKFLLKEADALSEMIHRTEEFLKIK